MEVLGIDVGGTGIKGAPVNLETEEYLAERYRIPTPRPAKPKAIAETVQQIVDHFDWKGPVGVGFPTVIVNGKAMQYSNLHPKWEGVQVDALFEKYLGLPVTVINDADAAGLAEMHYGVGQDKKGLVITLTLGTGIGSGLFYDGQLIPNVELGQLPYKKGIIEEYASRAVMKKKGLSYAEWGERVNYFLHRITEFCSPDLFIIGGGASKHLDEFRHKLTTSVPILQAHTKNHAGIIGAAYAAELKMSRNINS
ncbi:polyphosphate--glucose phosphotransferase [Croceiramulus getboli]|nr:ROK family protein [Flavobacteriaceae bacterium YJPT1-3]